MNSIAPQYISKLSSVDEYGFERGQNFDARTYEEFMSEYLVVLARRARKWDRMLRYRHNIKKSGTLKRYVRKGIPWKQRSQVWFAVGGVQQLQNVLKLSYDKVFKTPIKEDLVDLIDTDIPRTFPDNIYIKGVDSPKRESLRRMLLAYTVAQPHTGYCQGLNYVAGLMLLVVRDEEKSFWLFAQLVTNSIPQYHTPEMFELLAEIHTLGSIICEKKPLIWLHLQHFDLDLSIVVTKWFICLYVGVLPVETVLRIWDCLFYEGSKMMIRVAFGLILMNEESIFMSQSFASLVSCFKAMTSNVQALSCHTFMEKIFSLTKALPRGYIERLRTRGREEAIRKNNELIMKREGMKNERKNDERKNDERKNDEHRMEE